jgi:hypothetical protein
MSPPSKIKESSSSANMRMDVAAIDINSLTEKVFEQMFSSNSSRNINIGCNQNFLVAGGDAALTGSGQIYIKNVFEDKWDDIKGHIDLSLAAEQLSEIRLKLKANSDMSLEKELAICAIAAAEDSAMKKDGVGVLKHLQKLKPLAGPLTSLIIAFTASAGGNIAAQLIKTALGLSPA